MDIGSRDIIGIKIGECVEGSLDLYEFDMWLLGQHVTRIDNIAYLKSVLYQAEDDLIEKRDLHRFSKYFHNMSPEEAHNFILSTRDPSSEYFDIEDDLIYPNQQILNWGPNTDNVACFIVPLGKSIYASIEHYDNKGVVFTGEISPSYFSDTISKFIKYGTSKI
ncbi:hypothetical protein [Microbulbifer variabilis]|uniref:hypothetical protein n=1 Tax=Microbulbifer variabilis TaxID=266805 RepID=UPI001CFD4653|nr:hypothetical protein [Microbulbifer variabilis]